ncbi:hypothetical protein Tco_1248435, partial [Tanacetum coccineum]
MKSRRNDAFNDIHYAKLVKHKWVQVYFVVGLILIREGRASEKRDVNRNQTTQSLAVKQ